MFELFTAMSFNSCSDIPCLFILLILAAFYGQRKQYSRAYRQGSFFIVYFIMFMLVLKLVNDILNRIPFIKDFMKYNKASTIVQVNHLVFGGSASLEDGTTVNGKNV